MTRRIDLHWILIDILGTRNEPLDKQRVYFQPPSTIKLLYPCIIYKRDDKDEIFANNFLYQAKKRYLITVIDKNPDSEIPDKVAELQYCSFNTNYVADNLNHDVYSIYY